MLILPSLTQKLASEQAAARLAIIFGNILHLVLLALLL